LMSDDGCSSCHLLNIEQIAPMSATWQEDEIAQTDIMASFSSMNRDTCTQCHQQGRAPDDCLTCHKYHVERKISAINNISDQLGANK